MNECPDNTGRTQEENSVPEKVKVVDPSQSRSEGILPEDLHRNIIKNSDKVTSFIDEIRGKMNQEEFDYDEALEKARAMINETENLEADNKGMVSEEDKGNILARLMLLKDLVSKLDEFQKQILEKKIQDSGENEVQQGEVQQEEVQRKKVIIPSEEPKDVKGTEEEGQKPKMVKYTLEESKTPREKEKEMKEQEEANILVRVHELHGLLGKAGEFSEEEKNILRREFPRQGDITEKEIEARWVYLTRVMVMEQIMSGLKNTDLAFEEVFKEKKVFKEEDDPKKVDQFFSHLSHSCEALSYIALALRETVEAGKDNHQGELVNKVVKMESEGIDKDWEEVGREFANVYIRDKEVELIRNRGEDTSNKKMQEVVLRMANREDCAKGIKHADMTMVSAHSRRDVESESEESHTFMMGWKDSYQNKERRALKVTVSFEKESNDKKSGRKAKVEVVEFRLGKEKDNEEIPAVETAERERVEVNNQEAVFFWKLGKENNEENQKLALEILMSKIGRTDFDSISNNRDFRCRSGREGDEIFLIAEWQGEDGEKKELKFLINEPNPGFWAKIFGSDRANDMQVKMERESSERMAVGINNEGNEEDVEDNESHLSTFILSSIREGKSIIVKKKDEMVFRYFRINGKVYRQHLLNTGSESAESLNDENEEVTIGEDNVVDIYFENNEQPEWQPEVPEKADARELKDFIVQGLWDSRYQDYLLTIVTSSLESEASVIDTLGAKFDLEDKAIRKFIETLALSAGKKPQEITVKEIQNVILENSSDETIEFFGKLRELNVLASKQGQKESVSAEDKDRGKRLVEEIKNVAAKNMENAQLREDERKLAKAIFEECEEQLKLWESMEAKKEEKNDANESGDIASEDNDIGKGVNLSEERIEIIFNKLNRKIKKENIQPTVALMLTKDSVLDFPTLIQTWDRLKDLTDEEMKGLAFGNMLEETVRDVKAINNINMAFEFATGIKDPADNLSLYDIMILWENSHRN